MNYLNVRARPAGESSDEDEFADFMSDDEKEKPALKYTQPANIQERENDRIFQLFINGNLKEIISLLDDGFDVNKCLRDDWTPLLLAASVAIPEVTDELIQRGADVNKHKDYYTPLMAAAACPKSTSPYESSLVVVRQLLNNNANVQAKTRKRINALMYAASNGNLDVVKELLPHSEKLAEDNQGWTALFWAVSGNSLEVVDFLLEEGFPCNKFDVRGYLPIHYAKENDFTEIINILPALKEDDENPQFVFTSYGYQDFFDTGSSNFTQDIVTMLYGMKNEKNMELFIKNGVSLFNFLTMNEEDLQKLGIKMPYERYRILCGLHKFHLYPYKTKALPIVGKSELYSTLNVANSVLSACRQFVAMRASLRYILRNVSDTSDLEGFDQEIEQLKNTLNKIGDIVNKINVQAIEWDRETRPADLLTNNSFKKLKPSKLKYYCMLSIFSIVGYLIWKNYK